MSGNGSPLPVPAARRAPPAGGSARVPGYSKTPWGRRSRAAVAAQDPPGAQRKPVAGVIHRHAGQDRAGPAGPRRPEGVLGEPGQHRGARCRRQPRDGPGSRPGVGEASRTAVASGLPALLTAVPGPIRSTGALGSPGPGQEAADGHRCRPGTDPSVIPLLEWTTMRYFRTVVWISCNVRAATLRGNTSLQIPPGPDAPSGNVRRARPRGRGEPRRLRCAGRRDGRVAEKCWHDRAPCADHLADASGPRRLHAAHTAARRPGGTVGEYGGSWRAPSGRHSSPLLPVSPVAILTRPLDGSCGPSSGPLELIRPLVHASVPRRP
jgi:hypothetical protein